MEKVDIDESFFEGDQEALDEHKSDDGESDRDGLGNLSPRTKSFLA